MNYLTYDEYAEIGGDLPLTAYQKNIDRVCAMIDIKTQDRLKAFDVIPKIVKVVCADLLEYCATNVAAKPMIASKSQSAGGVSESETYAIKTADDYDADIDRIMEPLSAVKTKNGVCITYQGAMS